MSTFSVSFSSRNDTGEFMRKSFKMIAETHEEVASYIRHGERHGKWAIEGDIIIDGPIATNSQETRRYEI
jgi:hypothetical protein